MKTYQPKAKEVKRNWHLIDAKDKVLGRLASEVAKLLMGKQKSNYSAHIDMGDNVVVINAKNILLTGNKKDQKVYRTHSGYPGGYKEVSFEKMSKDQPEKIVELAVSGMLPDNRLKSPRMGRLHVFAKENHDFEAKFNK